MKSVDIITALRGVPEIVAICDIFMYSYPPIKTPESPYLYFTFAGRERVQVANVSILRIVIHSKKIDELEALEEILINKFEENFLLGTYKSQFISSNPNPIILQNGYFATILRFKVWESIQK